MSASCAHALIPRMRGRAWLAVRSRVLRRDDGLCVTCRAQGRVTAATAVDHRLALHLGGGNDDENLQSLCDDCHRSKSAAERGYRTPTHVGADGWPTSQQGMGGSKVPRFQSETARPPFFQC